MIITEEDMRELFWGGANGLTIRSKYAGHKNKLIRRDGTISSNTLLPTIFIGHNVVIYPDTQNRTHYEY